MKSYAEWLDEAFTGHQLTMGRLTAPRSNMVAQNGLRKVEIKPLMIKGERLYQFAYFDARKVTHRNLRPDLAIAETNRLLEDAFSAAALYISSADLQIWIASDGNATVKAGPPTHKAPIDLRHDRAKSRLLPEGKPIDFLVRLGVMTQDGRVVASKYDKYKQINRFLELASEAADKIKSEAPLKIVDFGSGKSYLTFALYYYFTVVRGQDVRMVGLDLKKDVIEHCSDIAQDLGYTGLSFAVGDIAGYSLDDGRGPDMVVSLHACDTATDDALAKAVAWRAAVILAAPCCQHELMGQIRSDVNRPILKHGILRERLAALVTDALRAQWLETMGYSVQVLEFIDTEHTPKNLLIRAVRSSVENTTQKAAAEFVEFRDYWNVHPHLEQCAGCVPSETAAVSEGSN